MTSSGYPSAPAATPWYRQASKLVAAAASTGAGCVSIITFLYSYGVVGKAESHKTIGNLGVAWVGVRPAVDTATAIGDTLHLAATITDRAGAILVGTTPAWSSENSHIAVVRSDGSVVAQGPGTTTITVAVGGLVARSRIVVRQRASSVDVIGADGSDVLTLRELDRRPLRAHARDARGHDIADVDARWHVEDTAVVALDSAGIAAARAPGRTIVTATVDGVAGHAALSVVAAPAEIALLSGAGQHAPAGRALPQNVVVRVVGRRGQPVNGALVTFRVAEGGGVVEPASALSDTDGRARASWTLGALPGTQSLLAAVQQLDSTLVVAAEADPLAENTRAAVVGDPSGGVVATTLADPVQLRVTDSAGRALPGVPVSWHALQGTVEPLTPRTDSAGIARARWTFGPAAGTQRLRAQVGSARGGVAIAPVTITATARPGAAAKLAFSEPRGSLAKAGQRRLVATVTDAYGNPVPNASLALTAKGGRVSPSQAVSDERGRVSLAWTPGGGAVLTGAISGTGVRETFALRREPRRAALR